MHDFSILNKIIFEKECGITPNEREVIVGLIMAQDEEYEDSPIYKTEAECPSHIPDTSYLIHLQNVIGKIELRKILLTLQEKGLILKSCKLPTPDGEEGLKPNDVKFNKIFLKKYIRHSGIMFWELFWAYPECVDINGKLQSLRNTFGQGGWTSLDEAASCYAKIIQFNALTHRQIINIIEAAREKGLINMGIIKFIRGEEWRTLEKVLNGSGNSNINTDITFV